MVRRWRKWHEHPLCSCRIPCLGDILFRPPYTTSIGILAATYLQTFEEFTGAEISNFKMSEEGLALGPKSQISEFQSLAVKIGRSRFGGRDRAVEIGRSGSGGQNRAVRSG